MMDKLRPAVSLRRQMIILMIICWLIPIGAVAVIFGSMLTRSYEQAQQQEKQQKRRLSST